MYNFADELKFKVPHRIKTDTLLDPLLQDGDLNVLINCVINRFGCV